MSKYLKVLIAVVLIVIISVGSLYIYLNVGENSPISDSSNIQVGFQPGYEERDKSLEQGEAGFVEENVTTVAIGTDKVARGNFIKVEAGEIYFATPVGGTKMPMTADEVVVACTDQDLAGASELDFSQVTSVKITNPTEMEKLLEADIPIVVFSDIAEGGIKAHTIAVPGSSCPQQLPSDN